LEEYEMTTDITPENVARMLIRLRGTPLYEGHGEGSDAPDEAADMLEALSARLAEVNRRLESARQIERNVQMAREHEFKRAEAAEAKLTASDAREVKLQDALAFYADLSSEGPWHLPGEDYGKRARAALQENKP
jgi:hypothetical protein